MCVCVWCTYRLTQPLYYLTLWRLKQIYKMSRKPDLMLPSNQKVFLSYCWSLAMRITRRGISAPIWDKNNCCTMHHCCTAQKPIISTYPPEKVNALGNPPAFDKLMLSHSWMWNVKERRSFKKYKHLFSLNEHGIAQQCSKFCRVLNYHNAKFLSSILNERRLTASQLPSPSISDSGCENPRSVFAIGRGLIPHYHSAPFVG